MLRSVKIIDEEDPRDTDGKLKPYRAEDAKHNHVSQNLDEKELSGDKRVEGDRRDLSEGIAPLANGVQRGAMREGWMANPHDAWEKSYSRRDVQQQQKGTRQQDTKQEVSTRHVKPLADKGPHASTSFTVGDGGASWRMKALKRAQIQAQVEGTSLTDAVQQRWGSVKELAEAAERAAPSDAHHRSKKYRNLGNVSLMKGKMKRPRTGDRVSGRDGRDRQVREDTKEYADIVDHAARDMNSFKDDGTFMARFENPSKKEKGNGLGLARKETEDVKSAQQESHAHADSERMDNTSVAAMLRARLSGRKVEKSSNEEKEIVLPMVDASGKAAPGAFGRETAVQAHGSRQHGKRLDRYEEGLKSRYFANDDTTDLDTMVRRTKHGVEEQMDAIIARNIAKRSYFKGNEFNVDDEYEFDAGLEFLESSKVSKRGRQHGQEKDELARKEKARQIREYKSTSRVLDRCKLCLGSNSRKKHLMVSVGTCAYLAIPEKGRLIPGHCCVMPTEHIPSARVADENTWEEMRNFKKCVLQMFADKGSDCIFIETVLDVDPMTRSHAIVECIPVPKSVASKAPMYFKKAIDDATNDWSQHASKRCIETESRHLQRKIPPNFPYVHIEFGLAAGFVHVIDDPKEFDPLFARRVVIGLMGLPEEDMHGRLSREGEHVQRQWVEEFQKAYKAYDWVPQPHEN